MQSLLLTKLASERFSIWVSITLMFTYTILLDRDFECTCEPQEGQCGLYIGLPIVIILLLILWTDRSFKRDCTNLCSWSPGYSWPDTYSFWVSFVFHILKAALVGLLWVAFVYLDGDWYVCCENDHTEQAPLACKAKNNITEKERVTIAELKNKSRVIGSFTLFAIALGVFLMPPFLLLLKRYEGKKLLEEKSKKSTEEGDNELEEILEEGDHELKEILKKSPKDKPTEKDPLDRPSLSSNNDEKENQSPGNSTSQEPLVQQDKNNQHEEQEDSDASFSERVNRRITSFNL